MKNSWDLDLMDQYLDHLAMHSWVIIDDFFFPENLQKVREALRDKLEQSKFEAAKIGPSDSENRITEIRSDYTYWLDKTRDQELSVFFDTIEDLMAIVSRGLFLSLQGYEFHFAHYPQGAYYKPHLDQFDQRGNRMLSLVIYLNQKWEKGDGGELKIHNEKPFQIDPIDNRAVLFFSDRVLHEVLPAIKERYSLTGWFLKRPSDVGVLGI